MYVIGIDEVGRGPLAGPVVLCAAAVPVGWTPRKGQGRLTLRDSKKLTLIQRELWADYLASHPKVDFAVVRAYPATIDNLNIAQAANKAARRALLKVLAGLRDEELKCVYLDGGLYLQKLRHPRKKGIVQTEIIKLPRLKRTVSAHTVVKGDEKLLPVKIASVLAKVHRDRFMVKAAKKFPGYGFEIHKGYGTKEHRKAVARLGPSKLHRLSFRRVVQ